MWRAVPKPNGEQPDQNCRRSHAERLTDDLGGLEPQGPFAGVTGRDDPDNACVEDGRTDEPENSADDDAT
jgi:hypothetical protein